MGTVLVWKTGLDAQRRGICPRVRFSRRKGYKDLRGRNKSKGPRSENDTVRRVTILQREKKRTKIVWGVGKRLHVAFKKRLGSHVFATRVKERGFRSLRRVVQQEKGSCIQIGKPVKPILGRRGGKWLCRGEVTKKREVAKSNLREPSPRSEQRANFW